MPKQKSIARETPLAEITLRKYEKPGKLPERELVRKLCLSFGLLQPGDSRDVIVDILHVLLKARKQKSVLSSNEIEKLVVAARKKLKLPMVGIAASNIRRQLRRLKDIMLVEKQVLGYRIVEFDLLESIFEQRILKYHLEGIVGRVREYCRAFG